MFLADSECVVFWNLSFEHGFLCSAVKNRKLPFNKIRAVHWIPFARCWMRGVQLCPSVLSTRTCCTVSETQTPEIKPCNWICLFYQEWFPSMDMLGMISLVLWHHMWHIIEDLFFSKSLGGRECWNPLLDSAASLCRGRTGWERRRLQGELRDPSRA